MKAEIKQVLNNNETWKRLNLLKTNKTALEKETQKAVARCKESKEINDFIKDTVNAAKLSGIDKEKIQVITKELCSEFITLVCIFPEQTDEEIIINFCKGFIK